jgi:hypothetical protein
MSRVAGSSNDRTPGGLPGNGGLTPSPASSPRSAERREVDPGRSRHVAGSRGRAVGVAQSGRATDLSRFVAGSNPAPYTTGLNGVDATKAKAPRADPGSIPGNSTGPQWLSSPARWRWRQNGVVRVRRVAGTGRARAGIRGNGNVSRVRRRMALPTSTPGSNLPASGKPDLSIGQVPGPGQCAGEFDSPRWLHLRCLVCEHRIADHCRHCMGCP